MEYASSSTPAEIKQTLQVLIANELSTHISSPPSNNAASSSLSALTSPSNIGILIDHTLLAPSASPVEIVRTTKEAVQWSCASVCVNSSYISLVRDTLREESVNEGIAPVPCAVVGFPLGAASTGAKVAEAKLAVEDGAKEIDMVIHVGYLKAKAYDKVYEDIKAVVGECTKHEVGVKVILEICLLDKDEIVAGSVIAREAGAAFIKTSTGFSTGGATEEAVRIMRAISIKSNRPGGMKVKASGGVGTLEAVTKMIKAGAERVGASRTGAIINGFEGSITSQGSGGY